MDLYLLVIYSVENNIINKTKVESVQLGKAFGLTEVLITETRERTQVQKLRDVQQEREGTSLNYFKIILNYIEQFSQSISLYLALSLFILFYSGPSRFYLGASLSVSVYLGQSRCISNNLRQSQTILDYLRQSRSILDYLGLYRCISVCLSLSRTS